MIYLILNPKNINFSKIDVHNAKMELQISVAIAIKGLLMLQILQIKINKRILLQQIKK